MIMPTGSASTMNLRHTERGHGVIGASVRRDSGDPRIIIVTHQFNEMNTAQTFLNSQDLRSAMERAWREWSS